MPYNHFNQYRKALRKLQQPVIIKALRKVGLEEIQISIMQSLWEAITNGPRDGKSKAFASKIRNKTIVPALSTFI